MSNEILRADARTRKRTGIILGIGVLACIATLYAFRLWLADTTTEMHTDALIVRTRTLNGLALTGAALCLALLAWQAARSGRLACQHAQWPLPGARVVRDTPIRRGAAAMRVGRLLQVAAVVLIALALAAGLLSWRLIGI
ncbi:MAG: hypothetical protein ABI650_01960 [Dokdonella sp.]